jgi:hypothetical protein
MSKSSFRLILSPIFMILAKGIILDEIEILYFWLPEGSRCPKVASDRF